jgi:hypothetical protein
MYSSKTIVAHIASSFICIGFAKVKIRGHGLEVDFRLSNLPHLKVLV